MGGELGVGGRSSRKARTATTRYEPPVGGLPRAADHRLGHVAGNGDEHFLLFSESRPLRYARSARTVPARFSARPGRAPVAHQRAPGRARHQPQHLERHAKLSGRLSTGGRQAFRTTEHTLHKGDARTGQLEDLGQSARQLGLGTSSLRPRRIECSGRARATANHHRAVANAGVASIERAKGSAV